HDLDSPDHLDPLFTRAMEESLGEAARALDELLSNFQNKLIGCLIRVNHFPNGPRHTCPSEALDDEVSAVIRRAKGDPT
ncbi:DUF1974 domain-containing protein, partial [Pseudomonas sp. FG1]|nr:DUF1974 domain-containing protein [Pseudomonas sp. FG1]